MKNTLQGIAVLIVLLLAIGRIAFGAQKYDLKYTNEKGLELTQIQALLDASKDKTVYKCQTVEMKPSKTGTSFSLRNVKKPKAE